MGGQLTTQKPALRWAYTLVFVENANFSEKYVYFRPKKGIIKASGRHLMLSSKNNRLLVKYFHFD
ncbi:hypothetical protein SAMN04487921_12838 [Bacillus altitudinis]|nr:hypothetical protein [Micromonospora sp. 1209]SFY21507.1 hypothetical protein SAMN04487921_12838 [Bacillus altitudinis]SIT89056.1 hypothetical protein SAMN05216491_2126 [Bacillus altitudinis]SNS73425.1 hypothetical protein SAMN05880584_12837 [Bacillus altitudinis]